MNVPRRLELVAKEDLIECFCACTELRDKGVLETVVNLIDEHPVIGEATLTYSISIFV